MFADTLLYNVMNLLHNNLVCLLVIWIISQYTIKTLTSVLVPYKVLNLVIMMRSLGRSRRLVLFLGRALTSGQDLGSCRDVFRN